MAAYQSLYRRFRPQRFSEVRGQDHIVRALRNAVREGRVAHAYLFSGPRGTGKTSTARILAKALNCTNPQDGEPDGVCDSCIAVQQGVSLDVHELDAASNNKVDDMRDLLSRVALGSPGRWKVYIVDEVHMLSAAASNALLKTLEEPPGHVVFVLATTDPQKVLPTIRSRTQHFEFRLIGPEVLGGLLRDVSAEAGLDVPVEALDLVVRRGNGSARDALSVLDQVAAAGDVEDEVDVTDELVEAIAERDVGRALSAVARGCAAGRDPRRLAVDLLEHLRNAFLASMAESLVALPDAARARVHEQGRRLGPAALVRAMEAMGDAQVDMRESLDPRVSLEVALVRITRPDADVSPAALLERIERLERGLSGHVSAPAVASAREAADAVRTPTASAPAALSQTPPTPPSRPGSRPALGGVRKAAPPRQPTPAAPRPEAPRPPEPQPYTQTTPAVPPAAPAPSASGPMPSRDDLTKAWGDVVLGNLSRGTRARYAGGRFVSVDGEKARFALPNAIHAKRCAECRDEVEKALSDHFGTRVKLDLVVEAPPDEAPVGEAPPDEEFSPADLVDLDDAPAAVASPAERLKQAFPGAEEVEA